MSNYIVDRMELNEEQILWFCFLSSITYQLPTAYLIINEYPDLENVDIPRLSKWWEEVQARCPFQTDKLKQRKFFPETVESYQKLVGKSQIEFMKGIVDGTPQENFDNLWQIAYKDLKHFGRFSFWNWAQMLKQVAKLPVEPESLMFGEPFSESHTHGACYAFSRDQWAVKERFKENGKKKKIVHSFTKEEKSFLEEESRRIATILSEDVPVDNYFLETVYCAFKKLFRERDSRYIGFYLDRQAEDIKKIEKCGWYGVDWSLLWDARKEILDPGDTSNGVNTSRFKEPIESKIQRKSKEQEWWLVY